MDNYNNYDNYGNNIVDLHSQIGFCQNLEQNLNNNILLQIIFPTLILLVGNIITIYHNTKLQKENTKLKNIIRKPDIRVKILSNVPIEK